MKKLISIIFAAVLMLSAAIPAQAVDVIDTLNLLEKYTTRQIADMYPEFCGYLAAQFRALNTDIDVERFSIDKNIINSIFLSVLCENPDIFYVNPKSFETTSGYDDGILVSIRPDYLFDTAKIPAEIEKFNNAADIFLKNIDQSWDDFTKARYLHDQVATFVEYNMSEKADINIYTAYGAMVQNVAVCEGYTLAYNYLLDKVGIEALYVQSLEARHSWTLVKLDGKYYHVDVTLDDPIYDNLGRVNHTFFLMSETLLNQNDKLQSYTDMHINRVNNIAASDTGYDSAWWRGVNTFIYPIAGMDYYVNQTYGASIYGAIMKRNSLGREKDTQKITTRWEAPEAGEGAFWERAFCYLMYDGEYLYYNSTDQVFRAKPDSTYFDIIYTKPEDINADIYGVSFKPDGSLYITMKRNPNIRDTVYRLESLLPLEDDTNPSDAKKDIYTVISGGVRLNILETSAENTIIPISVDGYAIVELGTELLKDNKSVKTVIIPESVKKIDNAVFLDCENLETVFIPKSVTEIGKNAFSGCPKLTIEGYAGSAAQLYAQEYGLHFTAVDAPKQDIDTKTDSGTTTKKTTVTTTKKYALTLTLYKGYSYTLPKKFRTGSIKYTCKNKKIASISSKGKIKALKKGKTTITAKTKSFTLTVKVKVKPQKLNYSKKTLKKGNSFRLSVKGTDKLVRFSSSNKKVATVTYNGKVKARTKGTATITAKFGKTKLKCKVKVK